MLLAASLTAAAAAGLAAFPAAADRNNHNTLDDRGKPFGVAWSETGRFETLTATGIDDVRLVSGDRWRIRATGDARAIAQLRFVVERDSLIVGRVSEPRERFGKAQVEQMEAPVIRFARGDFVEGPFLDCDSGVR